MSLFARIRSEGPDKIIVHRWGSSLRQWAAGQLTRQNIIDGFALVGSDITELDALRATYDALPTNNTANIIIKSQWINRMEDVFILIETGDYTEAKAKSALGF